LELRLEPFSHPHLNSFDFCSGQASPVEGEEIEIAIREGQMSFLEASLKIIFFAARELL